MMKIIGHQKQWRFLKKTVELGRLPHAYLFSGPSQIGKKTLALELIKFLNCQSESLEIRPCQTCKNCRDIEKKIYPDFVTVEPENKNSGSTITPSNQTRTSIQISQIRDLRWRLSLHPYEAKIKTVIIDQADSMTQEAQSAFLKTLEEPKGKTLFILITSSPERLLPTILSRCEKLRFHPIPRNEIEDYLRERGIPEKEMKKILQFCFGKTGLVLNFLSDPSRLEQQEKIIKEVIKINELPLNLRFEYAKILSNNEQNLKEALVVFLRYFRGVLLSAARGKHLSPHPLPERSEGWRRTNVLRVGKLIKILKLTQNINFLVSTTNINSKLALEILLMEL